VWVGLQPGLSLRVDGGQGWTAVNASIHDYKHIDNRGAAIEVAPVWWTLR